MIEQAQLLLANKDVLTYTNQGIFVVTVSGVGHGLRIAQDILHDLVDRQAALFLSGGKTPKDLYLSLAEDEMLMAGVVALVDERFGVKMHGESNEKMIQDTGFLWYLSQQQILFYPILKEQESSPQQTAKEYDETVRYLLNHFPKSLGVLGIGKDGHTAGIAGNRDVFVNPLFINTNIHNVVDTFTDAKGLFQTRITMTFTGLSLLDLLLVLVFGEEKKEALQQMFGEGSIEEIPARFYKRPDIAAKTLLITDQQLQ